MIEDEELIEIQEMEEAFKIACDTHREYETAVILRKLKFQRDCPHIAFAETEYTNLITGRQSYSIHCKRCNKYIKDKKRK